MKLSIVIPTIGRQNLDAMIRELTSQMVSPDEEVVVIGDGPRPAAREIMALARSRTGHELRYHEIPRSGCYGYPARNAGVEIASGDRVWVIDDDDEVLPGALAAMRHGHAEYPDAPLMFRMYHCSTVIWREPDLRLANVSTQTFVPLRDERLAQFGMAYESDFTWICETMAKYPNGPSAIAWREEIILRQGYVGPDGPRPEA